MQEAPIFIVGVPRSGTTLLSALVSAHSRISCGPETHFFRWLAEQDMGDLLAPERWPDRAIDFVCSISRAAFSGEDRVLLIDSYAVSRDEVAELLRGQEPSVEAMLASVTAPYAAAGGKERWAEKTPDHLRHVHTIRRYLPSAPIIRIVRDPRDVAQSLTRMPWGTQSFLEGLLLWRRLEAASASFFGADDNSYTLRYEDLLRSPEEELRRLCEFIGEDFEAGMLNTEQTGSRLNSRNVPWKADAGKPIDASRVAMWQDALTDGEKRLAEAVVGDLLQAYGYPLVGSFETFGEVQPAEFDAAKYENGLAKVAADGVRFWQRHEHEVPAAHVYLGDPDGDAWIAGGRLGRAAEAVSLSSQILRSKLSGQSLYWIATEPAGRPKAGVSALVRGLLQPHRMA